MFKYNEKSTAGRAWKATNELIKAAKNVPDNEVYNIVYGVVLKHIEEAVSSEVAESRLLSKDKTNKIFTNTSGKSLYMFASQVQGNVPSYDYSFSFILNPEESVFISGAKEEPIIEETKMKVIPIVINKETYEITISIKNNALLINDSLISGLNDVAEIHWSGPALNISSDKSLYVSGDISGNAEASNHINCGNVGQNAIAGTSIHCGAVGGDVHSGGPVNIKK